MHTIEVAALRNTCSLDVLSKKFSKDSLVSVIASRPDGRILLAGTSGKGFIASNDRVKSQRGKLIIKISPPEKLIVAKPVRGDMVAVVGENRKLLVFPAQELEVETAKVGLILQRYKDGWLSDATTFSLADGLVWTDAAGRTRLERDVNEWQSARPDHGRMAPRGFPRDNKFDS